MGCVVSRHGQARTQKPCRGLPRLLQETARTQTTTLIPCSMRASGHVYLPACLHVDILTCLQGFPPSCEASRCMPRPSRPVVPCLACRSVERRAGTERFSTVRSRWSPYNKNKKHI